VLPFAVFIIFLALQQYSPLSVTIDYPLRIVIIAAVLWVFSRNVIDLRCAQTIATVLVGIAVFAIWVAPDILFPAYYKGRNLADSYYLSIPSLSWQNIVVGDPLCSLGKP